ncbi:MAG TPA: hypothetical protein VFB04_13960 [Terriglobales bacterium]|nr:hypothetical protein [Terriglobales bacterium]
MRSRLRRSAITCILVLCLGLPTAAQQLDEHSWGKNTAGVELGTHEDPRRSGPSGTLLMYNLLGKGFPAGKKYDLWFWKLGKAPQKLMQGVSFDKRGLLVCSGRPGECSGSVANDAVNIQASAMAGEPKRFAVVSTDGSVAGFAEAVPFPIQASEQNCKLSVVRQAPLAETVLLRASGYPAREALSVTGNFKAESMPRNPTVSSDGTWQGLLETQTPGQRSGTTNIKVAGGGCAVSVSFLWGEGSGKQQ